MNGRQMTLVGCGLILVVLLASAACGVGGCVLSLAGKANQQFGVDASLEKYERFKDIAARLDAKKSSIEVSEARLVALEKEYEGTPRKDWPRADLEQSNVWRAEVAGMKASFNSLAAEWNAMMAKENYRYANVGDLPKGADKPLPREFKPYETK